MKGIPDDITALKTLVEQLLKKIDRLENENAELRRRLGLKSGNSDKPPSSDGYRKKTVKPGIPKDGKRLNGGQKGHKGDTLKRAEKPDYAEVHLPGQCFCCGRRFGTAEPHEVIQSRQVFDLPEPKLEVTEHRIGRISCCGRAHEGEYPADVTAPVQYGAGVRALVAKLSVDCRMPMEQISGLFEDIYGTPNVQLFSACESHSCRWTKQISRLFLSSMKFSVTTIRKNGKNGLESLI